MAEGRRRQGDCGGGVGKGCGKMIESVIGTIDINKVLMR